MTALQSAIKYNGLLFEHPVPRDTAGQQARTECLNGLTLLRGRGYQRNPLLHEYASLVFDKLEGRTGETQSLIEEILQDPGEFTGHLWLRTNGTVWDIQEAEFHPAPNGGYELNTPDSYRQKTRLEFDGGSTIVSLSSLPEHISLHLFKRKTAQIPTEMRNNTRIYLPPRDVLSPVIFGMAGGKHYFINARNNQAVSRGVSYDTG